MATVTSMVNKIKNLLKKCENYVDTKTHSTGTKYDNLSDAVDGVLDVSSGLIDPFGVVEITENGLHNVREYDSAYVEIASGGTDVSDTTATASDVVSGKVFHTSDGASTSGSLVINSITPSNSSPVSLTSGTNYKSSGSGYAISSYTSKTPSSSPSSLTSGAFYRMGSNGYLVDSISNITPQDQVPLTLSSGGNYHMNSGGYCIGAYSNASVDPRLAPSFNMGWNFMKTSGYAYYSRPSSSSLTRVGYTYANSTSFSISNINLSSYTYVFIINTVNDITIDDIVSTTGGNEVLMIEKVANLLSVSPVTAYYRTGTGGSTTNTCKITMSGSTSSMTFAFSRSGSTGRYIKIYAC